MILTKKMSEALKAADLERSEINNVPMGTMYGLERRGLISSEWRKAKSSVIQATAGGMFPVYRHVDLTVAGMRAARTIKGLRADF